jgi:uncharacterized protein (TIGR00299 family) protein
VSERDASRLRGLHLHFDCPSGCAGDMTLAALFDLGLPEEPVRAALDAMGVGADRLSVDRVEKRGLAAVDVVVRTEATGHHHTRYRDIVQMIEAAGLTPGARDRALDMFGRVGRAEARMHATPLDEVAFHEVGAIDSIVDIVGTAVALDWLAPARVSCAGVAMGSGTVQCAHGLLPVPAPAALEIMTEAGGLMTDGGLARELCTPTGAAILAATVTDWGPMPALRPVATGYGAGDADLDDRANLLRLVVGRPATTTGDDEVYRVEANIDDMSPEMCEHAADALFAAGAVDVWWSSISMKRGRPALLLSALVAAAELDAVVRAAVRETTTIGVRFDRVARRVLEREQVWVDTAHGRARVKLARLDGEVVNAAPEYADCRDLARASGLPLKQIFAEVAAAYRRDRSDRD